MKKTKVYEQYEKIVDWFDEHRNKELIEKFYLDLIANTIASGGEVLDLGCGTGEPIAKYFIDKGFNITGVDGSALMIGLCKKRFPHQVWLVADMQNIHFDKQFDAILAWHSFFHLDHDAQRNMFKVFNKYLKSGGVLAFTSGIEHGECWSNNGGQELFHASLSSDEYEALLSKNSLKVVVHNVEDPECGDATIWVAQKF